VVAKGFADRIPFSHLLHSSLDAIISPPGTAKGFGKDNYAPSEKQKGRMLLD